MAWGFQWRPYVPVAARRAKAARAMEKLRKKGADIQPVAIEGRTIARTFWGRAWCDHLEKFSDFENRLPRGRTYVRNGSVCHLEIRAGKIVAKVSGSELYDVKIAVKGLSREKWKGLKERCAGQVGSMLELLQGKISGNVMEIVTDRERGLFPLPKEIGLDCSCPDWADMCKHVAAVLYGVGARLDEKPDLLFRLRGVDHNELVSEDAARAVVSKAPAGKDRALDEESLSRVFGIDLAGGETGASEGAAPGARSKRRRKDAAARISSPRREGGRPPARRRRKRKKP